MGSPEAVEPWIYGSNPSPTTPNAAAKRRAGSDPHHEGAGAQSWRRGDGSLGAHAVNLDS